MVDVVDRVASSDASGAPVRLYVTLASTFFIGVLLVLALVGPIATDLGPAPPPASMKLGGHGVMLDSPPR